MTIVDPTDNDALVRILHKKLQTKLKQTETQTDRHTDSDRHHRVKCPPS
jgi:hypothetical protein